MSDFLSRWEQLKGRRLHYYTIKLDTARTGSEADSLIISGDIFFILKNDASDLQIAFNKPEVFIPVPKFPYGKGYARFVQAVEKIYLKHSAVTNGELIIASGFPESVDIQVFTGQSIYLLDYLGNVINPAQAPIYSLYVKDITVTTTAQQIDTSSIAFKYLTLLADDANTATIYVGTASAQLFPLKAGASITLAHVTTDTIYVKTASGTATLYVIGGGHE